MLCCDDEDEDGIRSDDDSADLLLLLLLLFEGKRDFLILANRWFSWGALVESDVVVAVGAR